MFAGPFVLNEDRFLGLLPIRNVLQISMFLPPVPCIYIYMYACYYYTMRELSNEAKCGIINSRIVVILHVLQGSLHRLGILLSFPRPPVAPARIISIIIIIIV